MDIIYECHERETTRCLLRSNTYAHGRDYFLKLYKLATADFPDLTPENVEVVKYGGDHIKSTCGIEFVRTGDVPEKYRRLHELEYLL